MIEMLYKTVSMTGNIYTAVERALPYCPLPCYESKNILLSADGRYRAFFENIKPDPPDSPYCVIGISDSENDVLVQSKIERLHITLCAISSDGEIAAFQTDCKYCGYPIEKSLFLVYRKSKDTVEVIFDKYLKINTSILLGLEVFSELHIIRCHYRGCYLDYDFSGNLQNTDDYEKYLYFNGNADELVNYVYILLKSCTNCITDEIEQKLQYIIGEIENVFYPCSIAIIYRRIGEAYQRLYEQGIDTFHNLNKTLHYYRTALSLYPDVGIKTVYKRLQTLEEQYEEQYFLEDE